MGPSHQCPMQDFIGCGGCILGEGVPPSEQENCPKVVYIQNNFKPTESLLNRVTIIPFINNVLGLKTKVLKKTSY